MVFFAGGECGRGQDSGTKEPDESVYLAIHFDVFQVARKCIRFRLVVEGGLYER